MLLKRVKTVYLCVCVCGVCVCVCVQSFRVILLYYSVHCNTGRTLANLFLRKLKSFSITSLDLPSHPGLVCIVTRLFPTVLNFKLNTLPVLSILLYWLGKGSLCSNPALWTIQTRVRLHVNIEGIFSTELQHQQ